MASVDQMNGLCQQAESWKVSSQTSSQPNRKFQDQKVTQADQRRALSNLLAPEYIDLAFSLPPACTTTIWECMKEEMTVLAGENPFICDVEDLVSFLIVFFSNALVEKIAQNLLMLSESFLGPEYSLRHGKALLGCKVIDCIIAVHVDKEGPLAGFIGEVVYVGDQGGHEKEGGLREIGHGKGQSDQLSSGKSDQHSSGRSISYRGAGTSGRGGGRSGGDGGRRGRPRLLDANVSVSGKYFEIVETVEVLLPAFKTPPKLSKVKSGSPSQAGEVRIQAIDRAETIRERSLQFKNHASVGEGDPYDPMKEAFGTVHMFHGTRTSSFQSFKNKGIRPIYKPNEFCAEKTFYISNSLQHAFEHPLHNHPSWNLNDSVIVLVFGIDVEVLHGEKAPFGIKSNPFSVFWFEEPNDDWAKFCKGNLDRKLIKEPCDIVIGPMCIPKPSRVEALRVQLEGGVSLTQVALCSKQAILWMETCLKRVYLEKRSSAATSSSHGSYLNRIGTSQY